MIFHAEEAVEKGPNGLEARSGIGNEEDNDDQGSQKRQDMVFIFISSGKEIGDGIGADPGGIPAQLSGDKEEVEVGAHGKADGRP